MDEFEVRPHHYLIFSSFPPIFAAAVNIVLYLAMYH
jgi:hypothetical protein